MDKLVYAGQSFLLDSFANDEVLDSLRAGVLPGVVELTTESGNQILVNLSEGVPFSIEVG